MTAATPEDALAVAVEAVEDRLGDRLGDLRRFATALSCLGRPSASGARFSVVSGRGRPRWILPHHWGAAGPVGSKLYRPGTPVQHLGAAALEVASRAGLPGQTEFALDTSDGLGPEIATALGSTTSSLPSCSRPTLAGLTRRAVGHASRPPRGDGQGRAARLARARHGAADALRARIVGAAFDRDAACACLVPVAGARRPGDDGALPSRPNVSGTGRVETDALVELHEASDRFKAALGHTGAGVIAHGDFCGWNTSVLLQRQARDLGLGVGATSASRWRIGSTGRPSAWWRSGRPLDRNGSCEQTLVPSPERLHDLCERLGARARRRPFRRHSGPRCDTGHHAARAARAAASSSTRPDAQAARGTTE